MDYRLLVAFDRDSTMFARGCEVGMLHQRLHLEPAPVEAVVHASNAEMCLRLAEAAGLRVQSVELGEGWLW